jgi:hypothetical protein
MLSGNTPVGEFANEREILYKLFFDMKKDVNELKKMFLEILQNPSLSGQAAHFTKEAIINELKEDINTTSIAPISNVTIPSPAMQLPNLQPVIIDKKSL